MPTLQTGVLAQLLAQNSITGVSSDRILCWVVLSQRQTMIELDSCVFRCPFSLFMRRKHVPLDTVVCPIAVYSSVSHMYRVVILMQFSPMLSLVYSCKYITRSFDVKSDFAVRCVSLNVIIYCTALQKSQVLVNSCSLGMILKVT